MRIKRLNAIIPIIAVVLLFVLVAGVSGISGCQPVATDISKKDIVSKDTDKKNDIETQGVTDTLTPLYENAPEDLSIRFHWDTGTLPPQYNYYYIISAGPGLKGKFEYQAGYGLPPAPEAWVTDFAVTAGNMDELYSLLEENDFFRESWDKTEPSIGGSFSSMKITANGQSYEIPPDFELKSEDVQIINKIADFIKSLVPEKIWVEMERRQQEFEKSYEDYEK